MALKKKLITEIDRSVFLTDLTPEQKKELKGEKGDSLTYEDLTPEQKEALTGKDGASAYQQAIEAGYSGTIEQFYSDLLAIREKANKIKIHKETASVKTIEPNVRYVWDVVSSLDITLAEPTDNSVVNEYRFRFISGATATRLYVPSTVKWISALEIEANKIYEVSIIENKGLIGGWNYE